MDLKRTSPHLYLYHIRIMVDVVSCEFLTTKFARLMCYSVIISGDTELGVMERLISKKGTWNVWDSCAAYCPD